MLKASIGAAFYNWLTNIMSAGNAVLHTGSISEILARRLTYICDGYPWHSLGACKYRCSHYLAFTATDLNQIEFRDSLAKNLGVNYHNIEFREVGRYTPTNRIEGEQCQLDQQTYVVGTFTINYASSSPDFQFRLGFMGRSETLSNLFAYHSKAAELLLDNVEHNIPLFGQTKVSETRHASRIT